MNAITLLSRCNKHPLLSTSFALLSAVVAHAQSGNNIETSCDWLAPPTTGPVTCTPWVTTPGLAWDTKSRTCTQVTTGTKICVTHAINWVCSGGIGGEISRQPRLGAGATYTKSRGAEIARSTSLVTTTRKWRRSGCVWVGTTPLGTTTVNHRMSAKVSQNMTNLWDDFPVQPGNIAPPSVLAPTTVIFEGSVIPHGADIVLADYGPGVYNYYATRSYNGVADSIHFIIDVQQEHDLQPRVMLPSERHDVGIPSASAIYTNTTNESIEVIGAIGGSLLSGLSASVTSPVQSVAPGQSAVIDVDFQTLPGWVLTHGVPFDATLQLFETNGGATPLPGAPLASVTLSSGSISGLVGTGEDFQLRSVVGSSVDPYLPVKRAALTDVVAVSLESVGLTFDASEYNALFVDLIDYQNLPVPVPGLPGYHLGAMPVQVASNLLGQPAFFSLPLATGQIGMIVRFQAMVASPNAADGSMALSDAHDIAILN